MYINVGDYKITMKRTWILAAITTWVCGLLAHAYRFFNLMPTWDSMYNYKGTGATVTSGRWFLEIIGKLSTEYDLTWVNGAFSLFFISAAMILLVELLELKKDVSVILTAALFVTFPTVTSSFALMFTADCYMFAFALSVLAMFLAFRYKKGFLIGALCVCVAMGTYQAYLSVVMMTFLVVVLKHLLLDRKTWTEVLSGDYKAGIAIVAGAVLNSIMSSLSVWLEGVELSAYQGINSMGFLSGRGYLEALLKTWESLMHILGLNVEDMGQMYSWLNLLVLIFLFGITLLLVIKNKMYKKWLELIMSGLVCVALPICSYIIYFVSEQTFYHTLMEMGVCFLYLILVVYFESDIWKTKGLRIVKGVGMIVLVLIVYSNTMNANRAYFNMQLSYEKSYALAMSILEEIDSLDATQMTNKVAIMGRRYVGDEGLGALSPEIYGASNDVFLKGTDHYIALWRNNFGRYFSAASAEELTKIYESELYKDMQVYPYDNSVTVIEGVIVVKLSE